MVIETYAYTHRQGRVGLFTCECGCGQTFYADYKTRHPKYFNKTHRARAYRARARARSIAYQMWTIGDYGSWNGYGDALDHLTNLELHRNRDMV